MISNNDDIIDSRDVIARIEELQGERDTAQEEDNIATGAWNKSDEAAELAALENLMEQCKGNGGDEQWNGDWYPVTLIRDSYFEQSMDEMVEECYETPKELPFWMTITIDYTALQQDYTSVEFDGVTYWIR